MLALLRSPAAEPSPTLLPLLALLSLLSGCADGGEPPQPPAPPEPELVPPALPQGAPQPGLAPAQALSTHPPALTGPYELQWLQTRQGLQPQPATLLGSTPGCFWGRWLWDFGPAGSLRVHNELLCEDPQLGTGVCRAELEIRVAWQLQAFVVPSPVTARSQVVVLRPAGGSWITSAGSSSSTTIQCNINLGDVTARMVEVVPGAEPNRPQAVTLDLGNGERIHLVAATDRVSHAQIAYQHHLALGQ